MGGRPLPATTLSEPLMFWRQVKSLQEEFIVYNSVSKAFVLRCIWDLGFFQILIRQRCECAIYSIAPSGVGAGPVIKHILLQQIYGYSRKKVK